MTTNVFKRACSMISIMYTRSAHSNQKWFSFQNLVCDWKVYTSNWRTISKLGTSVAFSFGFAKLLGNLPATSPSWIAFQSNSELNTTVARELTQLDSILTLVNENIEADRGADYMQSLTAVIEQTHVFSPAQISDLIKCYGKQWKLI